MYGNHVNIINPAHNRFNLTQIFGKQEPLLYTNIDYLLDETSGLFSASRRTQAIIAIPSPVLWVVWPILPKVAGEYICASTSAHLLASCG
jgi:hypothetical protein